MLGTLIVTLFSWACAACTIHFFWHCLYKPEGLQKIIPRGNPFRIAYGACVFVGVGYCIFQGAEATLQWIPKDWVSYDEDGNKNWVGYGLAGVAAVYGTVILLPGMEKLASKCEELERLRKP